MIPMDISSLNMKHDTSYEFWKSYVRKEAERLFERAYMKSMAHRIINRLTGRSNRVCPLSQTKHMKIVRNRHYGGIRTVPIALIQGSENRNADFDDHFHPLHKYLKSRWIGVATEMLLDHSLPPVELIRLDNLYFVRDGHHRVSAARAIGQQEIEANVTTWISN